MIIASDLLELIGATALSFEDIGGVRGLVSNGVFPSVASIGEILSLLDDTALPDEVLDGFYEDLHERGFDEKQLHAVIDLGLVEYQVETPLFRPGLHDDTETLGIFTLTPLGKATRDDLARQA